MSVETETTAAVGNEVIDEQLHEKTKENLIITEEQIKSEVETPAEEETPAKEECEQPVMVEDKSDEPAKPVEPVETAELVKPVDIPAPETTPENQVEPTPEETEEVGAEEAQSPEEDKKGKKKVNVIKWIKKNIHMPKSYLSKKEKNATDKSDEGEQSGEPAAPVECHESKEEVASEDVASAVPSETPAEEVVISSAEPDPETKTTPTSTEQEKSTVAGQ
ncbi:hypothetical protein FGIG_05005 [Fasciola gigantica]|uniref:Uncharacterized protein n=1 Tax=Fasciola gigantica TaxID=46835 RepID=A0A504Z2E0_FASGI|nr:hypothetical protein FGIG_05005 [Fasciola gigantica]